MAEPTTKCDFAHPPLEEVVLGVQFAPPPNFRSTHFGAVHRLFEDAFPYVEDQPRLPPQFETFGGFSDAPSFQLEFGPPPLRGRVWFLSEDDSNLLQFQDDRLLLNWRKRQSDQPYPRYEKIADVMLNALVTLGDFFHGEFQEPLSINQAEISYINIIPVEEFTELGEWVSLFNIRSLNPEAINSIFSEIVHDDRRAVGRLTVECQTALNQMTQAKAVRLAITFRGAPFGDNIDSAKSLLDFGRINIIRTFCECTTERAHTAWGRST